MIFPLLSLGNLGCDLSNLGFSQAQTQTSNLWKLQEHQQRMRLYVSPPYSASLKLCDFRQVT